MAKRNKLEIIKDILEIVHSHRNRIKPTPLLRQSNISSSNFKQYFEELLRKNLIKEISVSDGKFILLTQKGQKFLEKYKTIVDFIDEFEL
jgi:predicted transcriptional regulator